MEPIQTIRKRSFMQGHCRDSPEQSKMIKIFVCDSYFIPVQGVQYSAPEKQIIHFLETLGLSLMIKDFETSFHQPVEISFDSLAAVASFQLVPKYE